MSTSREWLETVSGFKNITWLRFKEFIDGQQKELSDAAVTTVPETQQEIFVRERRMGQASMLLSLAHEFETYAKTQYEEHRTHENPIQTSQPDPSL